MARLHEPGLPQELHGRLRADVVKADEDAVTAASQTALIAGANTAHAAPGIADRELPAGDQWVKDLGSGANCGA